MQLIIYCIIGYLLLGAIGMAIANKKAAPSVQRERWLKYFTYILITSIVLFFIFQQYFYVLALLIVILGLAEIIRASWKKKNISPVIVLMIYSIISAGLIGFALEYSYQFQAAIYFQVLSFDAFSQITGQLFGQRSIVPKISPSKTIEGFAGGIVFCMLASLVTINWLHIPASLALLTGFFTAIISFAGDILASYLKRRAAIKDYSKLLPGQGGILDRFDSLFMTGCCYYILALANFI